MVRSTPEWQKGFNDYIKSTFTSTYKGETAPCPCSRCCCMSYRTQSEVEKHLVNRGFVGSSSQPRIIMLKVQLMRMKDLARTA
jgi:hypothetical protein